ncbi:hypothetical protein Acr_14g0003350 [Actinidia rufa]|uniref:Uncharacterized protein n=1 Tax=Actinidia rufa TaxID=165716 RepID=A0A7J0FRB8_9ERIC|nr:hypothetical protein Acr_14g0003350 [Actinidia rufa]
MGPDLELKGRSETVMAAADNKETAGVMKEPEDKHMRCASNYEDNTFEMEALVDEQTEETKRSQDVEVNILDYTSSGDNGLVEAEFQGPTESSSSFDDTISEFENATKLSDAEDESELHCDASSSVPFGGYNEFFRIRKKRLTPHWRKYIRPLMWRCKWIELQMNKLRSQAQKYDRELADYNQRKQLELGNSMLEENKRSATDAAFMDDDWGNQVICAEKFNGSDDIGVNELLSLEFKDGENSLEQIFWKIGIVQSRVSKMKTRVQTIISENPVEFSSTDKLSLLAPCNASTSSARNPGSPCNNGTTMPVGSSYMATQLIPESSNGNLIMPESAALSHGDLTHGPDMIESLEQPEVGGSTQNIGNGILIYTRRAKQERNNFKEVNTHPVENPQVPKEEPGSSMPPFHAVESDLPTDDQPAPKIRSISQLTATKNKRKRGRRKAGLGRWSRRSSG